MGNVEFAEAPSIGKTVKHTCEKKREETQEVKVPLNNMGSFDLIKGAFTFFMLFLKAAGGSRLGRPRKTGDLHSAIFK